MFRCNFRSSLTLAFVEALYLAAPHKLVSSGKQMMEVHVIELCSMICRFVQNMELSSSLDVRQLNRVITFYTLLQILMSKLRLGLLNNKLIGICVLIFVGLCVGLSSCTIFTKTNKQLVKLSEELGHTRFKKVMLPDGKYVRTLFTKVDSSKKPSLVLIHGAPGGVDNFKHFHENQKLLEKYNILSYDRPGYGKGTQYDYKSMPSLQKQADVLQKVILDYGITEYVLFSHSFGGPIALRHEAKHQRAKGILLASVAVDPEHEKIFWFAHIGRWKATRWMLAKALKTSADEKFAHVEELKKLQPELSSIKTKVIAIHGDEDSLVPYENLSYINKNLVNASLESITIKEENHFYPFSKPEICVEKLMAF